MISSRRSLFEVRSLHPPPPPSYLPPSTYPTPLPAPLLNPFSFFCRYVSLTLLVERSGAKAYYMHGVLHDWPDASALRILENQKSAMRPGYSRLLIHDHVVGRALDHPHATAYDLTMMGMVAGKERTEGDWQDLVARAGMRVESVWRSEGAVQGILEVVVGGV